jgi:uncharacterized protein YjdB
MKEWVSVLMAVLLTAACVVGIATQPARAADPTPPNLDFLFSPITGKAGDATGDGGGGADALRFQEYYVGQTFTITVRATLGSSNAQGVDVYFRVPKGYLNIALDGSLNPFKASTPKLGSGYPKDVAGGLEEYYFNNSTTDSSEKITGTVNVLRLTCTVLKQYPDAVTWNSTGSPFNITWVYKSAGASDDTNLISRSGAVDLLTSAPEDASLYLWPDTTKPYVDFTGSSTQAVDAGAAFSFNDKNTTTGDETGVDKASLVGKIKLHSDATLAAGTIAWGTSSGLWQTNTNPGTLAMPAKIGNRNFSYATAYDVEFSAGKDKASASQSPAGPNTMATVTGAFTTEPDTGKPTVGDHTPTTGNIPSDTNITLTVQDLKPSTQTYGTGVDPATIRVRIEGHSIDGDAVNKTLSVGDAGVETTAQGAALEEGRHYAQALVIDPSGFASGAFDEFAQNGQVTVTVTGAKDYAGNVMDEYSWTFTTQDTAPPEVSKPSPAGDAFYDPEKVTNELSFELIDTGVGVVAESLVVTVDNVVYTPAAADEAAAEPAVASALALAAEGGSGGSVADPSQIKLTGDANHWTVTITPDAEHDLTKYDRPFAVSVNAVDQSGNVMATRTWALAPQVGAATDGKSPTKKTASAVTIKGAPTTFSYKAGGSNNTLQLNGAATFDAGSSATPLTWTSSSTSIATVSSGGLVTFKGPEGSVTIKAAANDGSGKYATAVIKVNKNVTKVRTPLTTVYIQKGKSLTLPVAADDSTAPKKTVAGKLTWKSSNTKALTVNASGKIKASSKVKKTTKVTVTATSGNGKKLTVKVYVVTKAKKLNKVSATVPKTMKVGATKNISVKLGNKKATTLKVTFKSSKTKVVTVDKAGKLVAVAKGKAKITIKAGSKKVTKTVTVK